MDTLILFFVLCTLILLFTAFRRLRAFIVKKRRFARAQQVETIARDLGYYFEAEPRLNPYHHTHRAPNILNAVSYFIQNSKITVYDFVDGQKTLTYVRLQLLNQTAPHFRISQRTWIDRANSNTLLSSAYAITGDSEIPLREFFDTFALSVLDVRDITGSSNKTYMTLRLTTYDEVHTKEQYLDLIEAAKVMLVLTNTYTERVAAAQSARKTTRVNNSESAISTFWQGTRSRGKPRHQTPIACPVWLVSSTESRQIEDL